MGTISDYLNGIQKKYPDTQAVREQLEELRDTLHLKAEDLQAQGLLYEDASLKAITDLGDVTPLLNQVSGNVRTVYINRLSRNNALAGAALIVGEFLLCWLAFLLASFSPGVYLASYFGFSFITIILGVGLWPLIAYISCRQQPDKIQAVEMSYRKLKRTALLGWASISVLLFTINALMPQSGAWFMWPAIGVANWQLNIWLYHRQLVSGRYDAPERA